MPDAEFIRWHGRRKQRIKQLGTEVVATEAYLAEEKDFRSALTRIREANPDGIVLISYQAAVDKYKAKYNETPDFFAMHAYDTMNLIATAIEIGGPSRAGVKAALPQPKDMPSVIYGKVTFNPETPAWRTPTSSIWWSRMAHLWRGMEETTSANKRACKRRTKGRSGLS